MWAGFRVFAFRFVVGVVLTISWLAGSGVATDLVPRGAVVINEILYHTPPGFGADERYEFVELHCVADEPVDLTGWTLKDDGGENVFGLRAGTVMIPGSYLVVARDAVQLTLAYGLTGAVVGDIDFALDNGGDTVRLFDRGGALVDEVVYDNGLPWPLAADGRGSSLERVSTEENITDFTNFAASEPAAVPGTPGAVNSRVGTIADRFDIVINEIMYNPVEDPDEESLRHCPDQTYVELYNRSAATMDLAGWRFTVGIEFTFPAGTVLQGGDHLVVSADPVAFAEKYGTFMNFVGPFNRSLATGGEELLLVDDSGRPVDYVDYDDALPWPVNPDGVRGSLELVDPFSANDRARVWSESESFFGTPGMRNSMALDIDTGVRPGPQITRVSARAIGRLVSSPILSTDEVDVRARVLDADGVEQVRLAYQVVRPGDYIRRTDPRFEIEWAFIDMIYAPELERYRVTLPKQSHRTLVRYRIISTDASGVESWSPRQRDPEPNFAYFVYDGAPDYVANQRSAFGPPSYVHSGLDKLPLYTVIADGGDIQEAQTDRSVPLDLYKWRATFVYENKVYDHCEIRLRGSIVTRYGNPKRQWKIRFNKGNRFRGRFNDGKPYPRARGKINLMRGGGPMGDAGVLQHMAWRAIRDAGVMGSTTTIVSLRIVRSADELDQFNGDFFGVFLETQALDATAFADAGRPVDEGARIYKFDAGPQRRHPDCDFSTDDVDAFLLESQTQDREWFEEHLDIFRYVSFRTMVELTDNHDMDSLKNFYYYFDSGTRRWEVIPWDMDLAMSFGGGGEEPLVGRVLPKFTMEFRNRFRFLWQALWDFDRLFRQIEELSELVQGAANADRDRWGSGYAPFEARMVELRRFIFQQRGRTRHFFDSAVIAETPRNESPWDGALVTLPVELATSTLRHPEDDQHAATRWLVIERDGDWLHPTLDFWSEDDLLSTEIAADTLSSGNEYLFRAAYEDATGRVSYLSEPTAFTVVPPLDSSPPTRPGRPVALRFSGRSVELKWPAASDPESGLVGYWLLRDGEPLTRRPIATPNWTDFSPQPRADHVYEVIAVNGAGLESSASPSLALRTGAAGRGGWQLPTSGWDYLYEAVPGEDQFVDILLHSGTGLLDGSWLPSQVSQWDGGRPGDGGVPGGAVIEKVVGGAEDGGPSSVLTLEDPGNPSIELGPNNSRLLFVHDAGTGLRIDEGVTLIARLRVHPSPTDGDSIAPPPVPKRGHIGIAQRGAPRRHFSIWLEEGRLVTDTGHVIDVNAREFQSIWITLEPAAEERQFRLRVFLNGETTPRIDAVTTLTSGNTEQAFDGNYLEMGLANLLESGAIQIDYLGYKASVHVPVAVDGALFRRGDVNANGNIGLADAMDLLRYLFADGTRPSCQKSADADDSGALNVTDPIWILLHLFAVREELPAPFRDCGQDNTPDRLSCLTDHLCTS